MFFDPMYLIFVGPALLLMLYAQFRVSSAYKKYLKVPAQRGKSGAEVARLLLQIAGLAHITVEETKGLLTDHYDPAKKTLRLSSEVYRGSSVAAIGIAAHEAGHAVQHKTNYFPMKIRAGLVPVANIGTWLGYGCFFLGMLLSASNLVWAGVILFSGAVLFGLVTLPVEFNASARAKQMLTSAGQITSSDREGVNAVLSAAALTYIAAFLQAFSNLLYYIFAATGMSRKD